MNIARKLTTIPYNVRKTFYRKFKISAINSDTVEATLPKEQEEKFDFEDLKVFERTERRSAKIEPFMKEVFVSKFNRDLLAFPEILTKEEDLALENRIAFLKKSFSNANSTKEERKNTLRRASMYAATVNLTKNGLAANYTELIRYLEIIGADLELGQAISEHWVGVTALSQGLSADDYTDIIDEIVSGDDTISICIKERMSDRLAQPDFRTTAEIDEKGVWRINGEKIQMNKTGYILVLAITEGTTLKAFLVRPGAEGISYKDNFITFSNTPVLELNIANEAILSQTLGTNRLHTATLCRTSLQQATQACIEYIRPRFINGKPLSELSTIRSTIGEAVLYIYAIESAEYFTAGLLDGFMEPDAELEMAMCRNFISHHGQRVLLKLLAIPGVEKQKDCLRLLENMRSLTLRGENVEEVNMFIALHGLHHATKTMADEIKKIRNPFFNPTFVFQKIISNRHQEKDDPKLDLYLSEHLHPSLKPPSESLEYCVKRMRFVTEAIMSRHGLEVAIAYTELNRFAEAATEILVCSAVLARASRSYCIGLRNAENEMKLAACYVEMSKARVKTLLSEIIDGEYLNLDHFRVQFGRKYLDTNENLTEKPTARVFW
ncbi:complex I assembly factor ACAD9, mitochondrial [Pieris brassicae]|uniref:complex I assembly factor ACAD9, mitochondrial n=1 Tax=Pieris brassicae TaxID=7116 RepID=UPI001E6619D4|nr:complex I assembly factor ACAD9, mitochondrial [Pieris brassicae]